RRSLKKARTSPPGRSANYLRQRREAPRGPLRFTTFKWGVSPERLSVVCRTIRPQAFRLLSAVVGRTGLAVRDRAGVIPVYALKPASAASTSPGSVAGS